MDKTRHLKNLIALAYADGVFEENELTILTNAAANLGIPAKKLQGWLDRADEIVIEVPEDNTEREQHLIDMISLATADGYFSQDEYDLCKLMAEKLHYDGLMEALNRCMNRSNLKNLVALACADGHVDEAEKKVLKEAAGAAGLSDQELEDWIAKGNEFIHVIPEREEDRETQLIQMLSLAIADGEFSEDEYKLCKTVAGRLGFTENELNLIIRLSFKGRSDFMTPA